MKTLCTFLGLEILAAFWQSKSESARFVENNHKCSFSNLLDYSDFLFDVTATYILKIGVNYFLA